MYLFVLALISVILGFMAPHIAAINCMLITIRYYKNKFKS
jgi:hypothetical protein